MEVGDRFLTFTKVCNRKRSLESVCVGGVTEPMALCILGKHSTTELFL